MVSETFPDWESGKLICIDPSCTRFGVVSLSRFMNGRGCGDSQQRYRAGERILVFLYPQSKLGLTRIVGDPLGRITVGVPKVCFGRVGCWFRTPFILSI